MGHAVFDVAVHVMVNSSVSRLMMRAVMMQRSPRSLK